MRHHWPSEDQEEAGGPPPRFLPGPRLAAPPPPPAASRAGLSWGLPSVPGTRMHVLLGLRVWSLRGAPESGAGPLLARVSTQTPWPSP